MSDTEALSTALNYVSQQRVTIDNSITQISAASSAVTQQQTQLTTAQTDLMQADIPTVSTQLSLAETQQTALEDVIAQLESTSNNLFSKLAPFFSSTALPMRAKAVFVGAVAWLVAPLVAALLHAQATLSFSAIIGELAVGLVYGLSLTLLSEMLIFAGQIAGLQFSFSLVNLLDPNRRFRRRCSEICFN